MMTLNKISALLMRCRYKPGSRLTAEPTWPGNGVVVHISIEVINVLNSLGTFVRGSFKIEPGDLEFMDELEFLKRLRSEILRSEEHEIDEWFMVDGNCYQEPHPEIRSNLSWHQKPTDQDQSRRKPRKEARNPWKTQWPEFAPVTKEGMMAFPEMMRPLPEPSLAKYQKEALERMVTEMRSGRMRVTPTPKMENEPMKVKKLVKWNVDPLLGTKLRRPRKG